MAQSLNVACTLHEHILKFRRTGKPIINDSRKRRNVSSEGTAVSRNPGSPEATKKLRLQYKKLRAEARSLKRELDRYTKAYKRDQASFLFGELLIEYMKSKNVTSMSEMRPFFPAEKADEFMVTIEKSMALHSLVLLKAEIFEAFDNLEEAITKTE
jgi:hypothetical protein